MQTIALEFRHENGALAANGSDVVMYLDERWNNASRVNAIWRKLEELRSGPHGSVYSKQHFVGFTRLGTGRSGPAPKINMSDPEPPHWVPRLAGTRF